MAGRRPGTNSITPLELKIMQALWGGGPCNVQTVQTLLEPTDKLAYNTVQTMLNVLHRKGRVRRTLKGRTYIYRTATTREKDLGGAGRDLIDRMFGGSADELVMSLIKNRQVDAERIAELNRILAEQEGAERDE